MTTIDFVIDSRDVAGWDVVSVKGEVDIYTAPKLRERIVELVDGGSRRIVVDLEGVSFMDSTGLGSLVAGLKRMSEHEGELVLVCTREPVVKVLQITGLDRVFAVHETVEAATA